jgi:hypothetical protein
MHVARPLLSNDRMLKVTFATVCVAAFIVGCAATPQPKTQQADARSSLENRHVWRVDFTVAANDPGKPVTSSAYTLNVEEHQSGEVRMGTNVALPSQARRGSQDRRPHRPLRGRPRHA